MLSRPDLPIRNVYVDTAPEPAPVTTHLFQIPVVVGELYGNVIAPPIPARATAMAAIVGDSIRTSLRVHLRGTFMNNANPAARKPLKDI